MRPYEGLSDRELGVVRRDVISRLRKAGYVRLTLP